MTLPYNGSEFYPNLPVLVPATDEVVWWVVAELLDIGIVPVVVLIGALVTDEALDGEVTEEESIVAAVVLIAVVGAVGNGATPPEYVN